MTVFLDSTGFHKKTLAECRREIEAMVLGFFGAGTDLSPEGPMGMLIATMAKWSADGWEGAQEYVTSRDPDQATGVQLDELFSEVGVYRLPATAARCQDVILWGTWGSSFTVAAGSKAKASTQPATYSLESDAVFTGSTTGPFRSVRLELLTAAFTSGITLSVTLDGVAYTEAVGVGEAELQALTNLAATINGGAFSGTADVETIAGANYLRVSGDNFTLTTFSGAYFTGRQSALAGVFVADVTGVQAVPEYTLDTILTPVAGWLSVEQPSAGSAGTDVETDTEMRIRRLQGMISGKATEDAIRNALYRVPGVSAAVVASNRTMTTDGEGRPPKSFEAIVTGGNDADVGRAIWDNQPAGIQPYGLAFADPGYSVIGSDGEAHYVNWSRPDPVYAWVEVTIVSMDPDGAATGDYEQAIKDAVAEYGNTFTMGQNFTLQKFYRPVYTVEGIYSVTLRIATTATEGGSPSYGTSNIAVAAREYLTFSASRVSVL